MEGRHQCILCTLDVWGSRKRRMLRSFDSLVLICRHRPARVSPPLEQQACICVGSIAANKRVGFLPLSLTLTTAPFCRLVFLRHPFGRFCFLTAAAAGF
jgi:hypothetical protein